MKRIVLLLVFMVCYGNAQVSDFESIDFTLADNIAKLNKGASLKDMGKLVYNLTNKLSTDVEKFRAIHTWVCQNIRGDYSQHTKPLRKRRRYKNDEDAYLTWNNKYRKKAFNKLIRRKLTMCTGYAYIIKELSFLAGIEAEIIDGYARTADANVERLNFPNHSWNSVRLNDKWYLCDATWSAGYMNENAMFVKDYNDGYFLADPTLFAKNHYPFEKKWFLNPDLIQNDFSLGPIVYGEAFIHNAVPLFPNKLIVETTKNEPITFSIKSGNVLLENISLLKTSKKGEKQLIIKSLNKKDSIISFTHSFKTKGYHDVHLKIKDDIIATYTIEVTK